jgi:hypothetical protein
MPADLEPPPGQAARVAAVARVGVRRVEAQAPDLCRSWRVRVATLARRLGIAVTVRPDLGAPARWRRERTAGRLDMQPLWSDEPPIADFIDIRPDLRESARRFALAHEIGHVILYREFGGWAPRLSAGEQEVFANAFAVELLVPRAARADLAERFRTAGGPIEFLRLADALGLSPRTLMRFAARHGWMRGLDRVWLDIRCVPNRYTGRDRRLRVFDAVLDRERWFLPANRSVDGALGGDAWLLELTRRTRSAKVEVAISRRRLVSGPRYTREHVPASVHALRLHHGGTGRGMEILALAVLDRDAA